MADRKQYRRQRHKFCPDRRQLKEWQSKRVIKESVGFGEPAPAPATPPLESPVPIREIGAADT